MTKIVRGTNITYTLEYIIQRYKFKNSLKSVKFILGGSMKYIFINTHLGN